MAKGEYLGEFEQLMLLAILRLGDNAYGMSIREEIEECAERPTSIGAVYITLDRLEAKGYISERLNDSTSEKNGRAKRLFRVERAGTNALKQSQRAIRRMMRGVRLPGLKRGQTVKPRGTS